MEKERLQYCRSWALAVNLRRGSNARRGPVEQLNVKEEMKQEGFNVRGRERLKELRRGCINTSVLL